MAVSLAHMSHEASRRRATALPSSLPPPPPLPPPPYHAGGTPVTLAVPGQSRSYPPADPRQHQLQHGTVPVYPAANQPWIGIPVAPMSYPPGQRHLYQPGAEYAQTAPTYQQPIRPSYHSPIELETNERPALPPQPSKISQQPPSPHDSVHSSGSSSLDTAPSNATSVEPDPLPPHSNPQALTQTQSAAFASSRPIPDVSLGVDEVWSTSSGLAEFRICREAAHLPKLLSSKPLLTVTRTSNGHATGTVKFHTFSTNNNIELLLPSGRSTSISHSGFLHNRWGFQPLYSANIADRWYWKKDRTTGGAVLEDARHKHGEVLARIKQDRLSFVRPRLSTEEYDEIVLSAVAMAEAARRQKRRSGVGDLGMAVGQLTGTDGGGES